MYEGHPSYEFLGVKPMYLFYDKKTNKWTFGPTLGNKSGSEYGSEVLTSAKCPGDPTTVGKWMRKTSVLGRWKKEASLKVICMK